jgi:hypothetical protein
MTGLLRIPIFHYRMQNSLQPARILSATSPFQAFTFHLFIYSSVSTVTSYGLVRPGIEIPKRGRDSPHPSNTTLGPSSPLQNEFQFSFPEIKRPERGVDHSLPSRVEVKERVECSSLKLNFAFTTEYYIHAMSAKCFHAFVLQCCVHV